MSCLIVASAGVNPLTILWSLLVLLVLAAVFGFVLAVLGKKLAVHEDERIGQVREHLSGANCGGCGYAGCDAFAKAIVEGTADINACSATSAENKKKIAEIMGKSIDAEETMIVVACKGGNNAVDKYEYMGYGNCKSMELLGGGRKQCKWGCLGMGSCVDACPFSAMKIDDEGYAKVREDRCVACGRCISACPKSSSNVFLRTLAITLLAPTASEVQKAYTPFARWAVSDADFAPKFVRKGQ